MKLTWLGHSAFLVEARDGTRIITDPFEAGSYGGAIGYAPIRDRADIVTVSHDHADHNAAGCVPGNPEVIAKAEEREVKGIAIRGVASYHDTSGGRERGRNIIFVLTVDGVRLAHLGDLGHVLSHEDTEVLGPIDVLLLPVGGTYTIGPLEAKKVAEQIGAKIVIPMHYKTDALGFAIEPVGAFLDLMPSFERAQGRTIPIDAGSLGEHARVVVLEYR
jgi:L-ascorbate metabolism protein UlaG (beta-lactamase superfamily)